MHSVNLLLQNFNETRNIGVGGGSLTNTRENRVNLIAEVFSGSGPGWKIESSHAYGAKLKAKGFYEFFGNIFNEHDTIAVHLVQEIKKGSMPVFFGNEGGYYGFQFSHKDRFIGAIQLHFFGYNQTLWLHNDIPEDIRSAVATAIPAFMQMTFWVDDHWTEGRAEGR